MKKNTHPEYRDVLFEDTSCGAKFIIPSAVKTGRTIEHEGVSYPYIRVEVSSESHPFYTGKQSNQHATDRVGKFQERFGKFSFTPSNSPASE